MTGDKSERMGKKRKQEGQLSGVCGINKSTTELQGEGARLGIAASRDSGRCEPYLRFFGA